MFTPRSSVTRICGKKKCHKQRLYDNHLKRKTKTVRKKKIKCRYCPKIFTPYSSKTTICSKKACKNQGKLISFRKWKKKTTIKSQLIKSHNKLAYYYIVKGCI